MFRRGTIILAFLGLFIPVLASAEDSTLWSFEQRQVPVQWMVNGWGVKPIPEENGLHIIAQTDGKMFTSAAFPHSVDGVRLQMSSTRPIEGMFLWHPGNLPEGQMVQLPFIISGAQEEIIDLDLSIYKEWDPLTDTIGIALPAGSDVTMRAMFFAHWSPFERVAEMWKSFWVFDELRVHSINFLWGPIIRTTPLGRLHIFDSLLPMGWSANRFFYGFLLIAAAIIAAHWLYKRLRNKTSIHPFFLFIAVFASVWIFFDIRMGSEFVSYAIADYRTYFSKPVGQRTFRSFANFYDVLEQSLPLINKEQTIGALLPEDTPILSRVRYYAYPTEVVLPGHIGSGVTTWLVFYRPDVRVDELGQLRVRDKIIAPKGTILKQFDYQSFLFQVTK